MNTKQINVKYILDNLKREVMESRKRLVKDFNHNTELHPEYGSLDISGHIDEDYESEHYNAAFIEAVVKDILGMDIVVQSNCWKGNVVFFQIDYYDNCNCVWQDSLYWDNIEPSTNRIMEAIVKKCIERCILPIIVSEYGMENYNDFIKKVDCIVEIG